MTRSFQLVDNKTFEADFFLDLIPEARFNILAARSYFSAFVSAARSITFVLQAVMHNIEGFDEWYSHHQENLKSDPIASYFLRVRNELQKIGITPIQGIVNFQKDDGEVAVEYKFGTPWLKDDEPAAPEVDVHTACRKYLSLLLEVIEDCYIRFGPLIDPHQYLTLENLERLGLSIEDIKDEMGFPRGWTDVGEVHERFRLEILRQNTAGTDIGKLFKKYLGRNVLIEFSA